MWLLEHEGSLFDNKRLWLKPGTKHLFGRTRGSENVEDQSHFIDSKSVSRQHLVITVSAVKAGDASNLYTRSDIQLADDSKFGTILDDELFTRSSRKLTSTSHVIKLGKWSETFKVTWHPVVLSFSLVGKKASREDPLVSFRIRLEPLDIKILSPFVAGQSTHVVADKRNTPKGLQALVNAKHIVTDGFVDAIVRAASPGSLDGTDPDVLLPSPLEKDFDKNWPEELDYLPPIGREPVPRGRELFTPNQERREIFVGYTFVFCDEAQFDTLQPCITDGGGKPLYFPVETGKSTAKEVAAFAKKAAGERGSSEFEDGSLGRGVVVVRFRGSKGSEDWAIELVRSIELRLGQRSIEQNEFLDAILTNDASPLRCPLKEEIEISSSAPDVTTQHEQAQQQQEPTHSPGTADTDIVPSTEPAPEPTGEKGPETLPVPRRKTRRAVTISRFKGFDDFDSSQIPKASVNEESDDEDMVGVTESQADLPVSQRQIAATPSRKRKTPPPSSPDNDAHVDQLLPAAAAMKRRRMQSANQLSMFVSPKIDKSSQKPTAASVVAAAQRKRQQREKAAPDVRETLRQQATTAAANAEAAARDDEEQVRGDLYGLDLTRKQDLVKIEDMEIRQSMSKETESEVSSDRWDPRWNGRKNFKRFRKRRAVGVEAHDVSLLERSRRVIVAMEEAPTRNFGGLGMGRGDYLQDSNDRRAQLSSRGRIETQETDTTFASSGKRAARSQGEPQDQADAPQEVVEVEDSTNIESSELPSHQNTISQGRTTRSGHTNETVSTRVGSNQVQSARISGAQTQEQSSELPRSRRQKGKRGTQEAPRTVAEPATKRQKKSAVAIPTRQRDPSDEEDEEGEKMFRFQRRRQAQ